MNLERKKILAREFLLVMVAIGTGLIAFALADLYCFYHWGKAKKESNEILDKKVIISNLTKTIDSKIQQQKWFDEQFNPTIHNIFTLSQGTYSRLSWHEINENDISIKYTYWTPSTRTRLSEIGFNTTQKLQEFIYKNRITKEDSLVIEKAEIIQAEIGLLKDCIEKRRANVYSFDQIDFGIKIFYISLFLLFIIRPSFYAISWSIQTLKQK